MAPLYRLEKGEEPSMPNKSPKHKMWLAKSTRSQPKTECIQSTPSVSVLPDLFCAVLSLARVDYLASSS